MITDKKSGYIIDYFITIVPIIVASNKWQINENLVLKADVLETTKWAR